VLQYPNALKVCLENLGTDPARFYGPASALPLGAGMLLRECIVAIPHPDEVRFETGVGLGLVLTHECDIDQNNERHFNDLFLVCPVIPLDIFCARCEREEGVGSWGGILPQIANHSVHRAMYLPPMHNWQICPEMEGGGIIYLNHISSCAVRWITDPASQAISSLTAEGLRAFDAKLYNHLFRPKVAQLLFTR
jgi:hypothetical protein